jgi:hypothetical protein
MARNVVVLADWEGAVQELAFTSCDEFLVGGRSLSKNRTGHLVGDLFVPTGHPRLAPARLRSTWLLGHLDAGTRLPELCKAAGIKGATVLSDLLGYLYAVDDERAHAMLRRKD